MGNIIVKTYELKIGDVLRRCEHNDGWNGYVVMSNPVLNVNNFGFYNFRHRSPSGAELEDGMIGTLQWEVDRSDRDPRTLWVSDDNIWAVVRCNDIYSLKPRIIASFGYTALASAINHTTSSYPIDYDKFVKIGSSGIATDSWHFQGNSVCFSKVKRLDLPWESADVKKVISNYPSKCHFCGASAYVSALSVDHEPGKAAPNCPANR